MTKLIWRKQLTRVTKSDKVPTLKLLQEAGRKKWYSELRYSMLTLEETTGNQAPSGCETRISRRRAQWKTQRLLLFSETPTVFARFAVAILAFIAHIYIQILWFMASFCRWLWPSLRKELKLPLALNAKQHVAHFCPPASFARNLATSASKNCKAACLPYLGPHMVPTMPCVCISHRVIYICLKASAFLVTPESKMQHPKTSTIWCLRSLP